MVLEGLYSRDVLVSHHIYPFIQGFAHALFGIATAVLLFPENPTLVAVGITALVLLPSIKSLIGGAPKPKSDVHILASVWKSYSKVFSTYLCIFFGLFLAFGLFSLFLSSSAANHLFANQLRFLSADPVLQDFSFGSARELFFLNIKVLAICFLASFIDGTGAVFILTWNASVWATVFGTVARASAGAAEMNPFLAFGFILLAVLPHTIIESASYVLGGIAGTVLSNSTIQTSFLSVQTARLVRTSLFLVFAAFLVLLLGAVVEAYFAPMMLGVLFS